jgi:undecaprenyl diphosphate synthase
MTGAKAEPIPQHIAIIMDGNGRWAKSKHLPRFQGHLKGVQRVEEIAETASHLGVEVLTVFAFSTENWARPKSEVSMLMSTLCSVLETRLKRLVRENIRLRFMGRREGVPEVVLKTLTSSVNTTKGNTGMILNLAFNYGGRQEIIDAVRQIARDAQDGQLNPADIDEETIDRSLYTAGLPDPDLLIRTSGEQRISNFLLWQCSYAELYFTKTFWPDFTSDDLKEAIKEYQKRERRFGKISPASSPGKR